ncbi:MAG: molybdopterin molybdotransferase MoeA [Myxococcaceae bacterium]|nr:molybdopterin molybdotransferase MoeA [Myxococcaceae bacterium]
MSLTPVEHAQRQILQKISPLDDEAVGLDEALGRSTTEDATALRTLPPADNSAMDGYALRAADVKSAPTALTIVERIFAGQLPRRELQPNECARIMTGGTLPRGADAVVMQEKTRALSDTAVEVLEAVKAGANVRARGEDSREGDVLVKKGTPLGIGELGLLWAQGLSTVRVTRRPRVGIVSSGDELVEIGMPHGGRIYDTNSPAIAAMVRRCGGLPRKLGIAPDRLEAVRQKIETGLAPDFDVLICIAGMSVGEKDYVREVLTMLGVNIDFWRVAMRPGKPLAFGTKGSTLVFGLPGNPVSSLVTFELFVRPALRKLQGLDSAVPEVPGVLGAPLKKPPGLKLFTRATVKLEGGALVATPLGSQTSGALTSAAGATHLIVLPPEVTEAAAGEKVTLIPVSWAA